MSGHSDVVAVPFEDVEFLFSWENIWSVCKGAMGPSDFTDPMALGIVDKDDDEGVASKGAYLIFSMVCRLGPDFTCPTIWSCSDGDSLSSLSKSKMDCSNQLRRYFLEQHM